MPPRVLKGLQVAIVLLLIAGVGCTQPTPGPEPPAEPSAPEEEGPAEPSPEPSREPSPEPSTPAAPAPEAAEELTVLSVAEGEVLIMKSGADEWTDTQSGTTIEEGDALKTGERSHALVTFFDGSTIELEAGTEIEAVELRHDVDEGITTIRLDQVIGNTLSRVKKLTDPASRYEVTTPAAVGAVRGSAMRVQVDADGTSTVVNLSGSITASAEGVTVEIPLGYQSVVEPGEKPSRPSLPTPSEPSDDRGGGGGGPSYTAAIAVNKTASRTAVHEGDKVVYTYNVTNPGEVALENVSVTDDRVGGVVYQAGDRDGDNRLDVGEAWLFEASYNVSGKDVSPLVNVASASGSSALGGGGRATVSATDTATVTVLRPSIALDKRAQPAVAHVGDTVTYSYNVTNQGNAALGNVNLADDRVDDVAYLSGDGNGNGQLDADEAWAFCGNYTVSLEDESPLVNVASVNASDGLGLVVGAEASCNVTILRLDVEITGPDDGSVTTGSSITVEGLVSDPTLGAVNVTVNDNWYEVPVDDGEFSQVVPVGSGENTITVTAANEWGESDSDSVTVYAHFELPAIKIELTWDTTGDDVDGHFIRPGGSMWTTEDDCYFWWLDHSPYAPDWDGSGDVSPGDPILDVDDRVGGGPEHITLDVPFDHGRYDYKVHFYSDSHPWSGATATVKIWIDDVLEFTESRTLQDDEVWDCAYIEWPSGLVRSAEDGVEPLPGDTTTPAKD